MNFYFIKTSKLLLGLALITISFSCCEKEQIPEEPPYLWSIDTKVFTGINPVYFDESYFIFPTNYQDGEMSLLRVAEKTGDTLYNVQLLGLDDNLSNSNAKAYVDENDNELHIILDRNFYKVDLETGAIKTKYDFPNFFWRSNIQDQFIYTCSFATLDSFYFSYFDKDIGELHLIYSDGMESGQTIIGGQAPFAHDDSFYLPYFEGGPNDFDNFIINISQGGIQKVEIDVKNNIIARPTFEDSEYIYMYIVDKMFAYDKESLSLLWELETVPGGSGPYIQTDDKIYMVPSREIELGEANIMYIIDKATGEYKTVESPASYGPMKRNGNYIYYVGWGDFMKFDMINEEFIPAKEDEKSRFGYQPVWGTSPNSKILFDDDGWHCFPL